MQHNYIYQGKTYILSKRASEISGYASDYIGQLCRSEKLDCHMVGHSWFVSEESLRTHMAKVWSADLHRNRADNLKRREIKESPLTKVKGNPPAILTDAKKKISSKQAALLSGYAPDYIGQLCRGGKIEAVQIGKSWMVVEKSLLSYLQKIKDEEAKKEFSIQAAREKCKLEKLPVKFVAENRTSAILSPFAHAQFPRLFPRLRRVALIVSLLALVVGLGSISFMRISNAPNVAIHQPMTATVYSVAESISNLFVSALRALASLLSGHRDLASNGVNIAVAPLSGRSADDAATKQAIVNSFSDEVVVSPDKSGTAGVITPIFRETKGKDFMYVIVPVNEARPP